MIHQTQDRIHTGGLVTITEEPVCVCDQGVWGRGGNGLIIGICVFGYTMIHQSRDDNHVGGLVTITETPFRMCEYDEFGNLCYLFPT